MGNPGGVGHARLIAFAQARIDPEHWPGGEPDRDPDPAGLRAFEVAIRPAVAEARTGGQN
jgi:hypothetical protein